MPMAVGCVKVTLKVSFPGTGCLKLTDVDDDHRLHTVSEKPWPQKQPLRLWVKSGMGYVVPVHVGNSNGFL